MAHILRRKLFSSSTTYKRSLTLIYHLKRYQSTQASSEDSSQQEASTPPPVFDYQAPKDDTYKNFESTQQFIRRYLIIFPLAAICLYEMICIRRNQFSRSREFKFFNKPVESLVGRVISNRVIEKNKNYIYKQDTEEVKQVKQALQTLIEANNLQEYLPQETKITLIHNDTVFMFMNLDQRFFLTIPIVNVSGLNEEQLALLLAHELSHYLLDHQFLRLLKSFLVGQVFSRVFKKRSNTQEIYDPVRQEFKAKTDKQKYSCFYPQQRVITKFYEKNCDILALQIWTKAYPNADREKVVEEVYGKLDKQITSLPYLDENELYNSTYTYKRMEVNKKIINAHLEVEQVK